MNDIIANTWAERAQAELGAAQRFRSIAAYLENRTVPAQLIQLAQKAASDEERHAFLCAKIAVKWGHTNGFEAPQNIKKLQPSWHHLPQHDSFLLDMILMCCITESFNASLLRSIYSKSKVSEEGRIVHQILKDEVQHGQLGWAFLHWETQRRDCSFVSDYLFEMLDIAIRDELFTSSHQEMDSSSYMYGVMPHQDRFSQFQITLKEVVCPGFEHFGIDATPIQNWLQDKSHVTA